jgi:hypothetical protein
LKNPLIPNKELKKEMTQAIDSAIESFKNIQNLHFPLESKEELQEAIEKLNPAIQQHEAALAREEQLRESRLQNSDPRRAVSNVLQRIGYTIEADGKISPKLMNIATPAQGALLKSIEEEVGLKRGFQSYSPSLNYPLLKNIGLSPQQHQLLQSLKKIENTIAENPIQPPKLEFTQHVAYEDQSEPDIEDFSISVDALERCIEVALNINSGVISEQYILKVVNDTYNKYEDSASIKNFLMERELYVDFASDPATTALLRENFEEGLRKVEAAQQSLDNALQAAQWKFSFSTRGDSGR